jgi:hypothetical protein
MSADLLRRAATRLRESALAAQETAPPSWQYAAEDYIPNRALLANDGTLTVATVYEVSELPALSDYLTVVHPPVALALADHLEHVADDMSDERAEEQTFPKVDGGTYAAVVDQFKSQRWDWTSALAVARAVLREPEGGDR